MAVRNMLRIEINVHKKLCVKLVIYKDHTGMHGQQNIKIIGTVCCNTLLVYVLLKQVKFKLLLKNG